MTEYEQTESSTSTRMRAFVFAASVLAAIPNSGCADRNLTVSEDTTKSTRAPIANLEEWNRCATAAVKEALKECREKGWEEYECFGAGGAGQSQVAINSCGPKPSSGVLTAEMKAALNEHCWQDSNIDSMCTACGAYLWYDYTDESAVVQSARDECKRIYAASSNMRKLEQMRVKAEAERAAQQADFSVTRIFSTGMGNIKAIMKLSTPRQVICVAYDSNGDPLGVQKAKVTHPVDEVVMNVGGAISLVENVECKEMK